MCGCTAQKYSYVPGLSKTCEYWPSVSSVPESKVLGFALLVTVCGTSSRFTHVTFVPALTVNFAGVKLKLSMAISFCFGPLSPRDAFQPARNRIGVIARIPSVVMSHVRRICCSFPYLVLSRLPVLAFPTPGTNTAARHLLFP